MTAEKKQQQEWRTIPTVRKRSYSLRQSMEKERHQEWKEIPPFRQEGSSDKSLSSRRTKSNLAFVFLCGVVCAVIAPYLNAYLRKEWGIHTSKTTHPLPEMHHLILVDESNIFHFPKKYDYKYHTTQLQKPKPKDIQESHESDAEALKSLSAALILKKNKRFDKARRIFRHALALAPKHPTILNHFGEFLEEAEEMLEADHMFVRALAFSPSGSEEHERAQRNRVRTSKVVEDIDREMLAKIDDKKRKFLRINEHSSSLRRAKKEAYIQHIYHTVGIEGNTMTLAQTRSVLETKLAVGGKSVMEHSEILGLDAALKYINQTLVDRVGEITMKDILEIHKRVIGYVDPIEAGYFRRTQVYVGDHVPPHPAHIDMLMKRFMLWLNSDDNFDLHPVRYAALAHYKLVYIHPFVDGNGRTSRLLMNLILMQSGFPPVIIRRQDRLQYYQHLVTANEGDIRPFIRFIGECAERTLDAYITAATEHTLSSFDDAEIISSSATEHFEFTDRLIMGGKVGPNITVEP